MRNPLVSEWSGKRDLNPRHLPWQGGAWLRHACGWPRISRFSAHPRRNEDSTSRPRKDSANTSRTPREHLANTRSAKSVRRTSRRSLGRTRSPAPISPGAREGVGVGRLKAGKVEGCRARGRHAGGTPADGSRTESGDTLPAVDPRRHRISDGGSSRARRWVPCLRDVLKPEGVHRR